MRVAHAHRGAELAFDGLAHEGAAVGKNRRLETRCAHGDGHPLYALPAPLDLAVQHAGAGGHFQARWLLRIALSEVLHDAAKAIAAHLGHAAVGVVHHHASRGAELGKNRQDPVSPDAEVAIAELPGQRVVQVLARLASIEHDEVVTEALVLEERLQNGAGLPRFDQT